MGWVLDINRVVSTGYKGNKQHSVSVKYHIVWQTQTLKSGNFCYYWRLSDKSDNKRLVWKLLLWPSTCLGLSPMQYRTALHLLHQEQIFATLSLCFSFGGSQQQSSFWSWKLRDSFLSAICLHKVSFTCPRAPTLLPAQQWFWSSARRIKVLPLAVGLLFCSYKFLLSRGFCERKKWESCDSKMVTVLNVKCNGYRSQNVILKSVPRHDVRKYWFVSLTKSGLVDLHQTNTPSQIPPKCNHLKPKVDEVLWACPV